MSNKIIEVFEKKDKTNKKRNVCAYARVSSDKDVNISSFNEQIDYYTNYIISNDNWNFCGVYADEGITGTSIEKRPQFKLMIERAKCGLIDLVITKSISRFARNTIDCMTVIKEFNSNGIEVFFENENISSFDPKIEFVTTILSSQAEQEATNVSENCRWGYKKRYERGIGYFPVKNMLGFDRNEKNELLVNENEAVAIKTIFEYYVSGRTLYEIRDWLELNNYQTGTGKYEWTRSSIMAILRNEKYCGDMLLQKTFKLGIHGKTIKNRGDLKQYLVHDNHPAIISRELFEQAKNQRLERISKFNCNGEEYSKVKLEPNKSIFAGFFRCSKCGKKYHYKVNNSTKPWANRLLLCSSNKTRRNCQNESLMCDVVEKIIKNLSNKILSNKTNFYKTLRIAFESNGQVNDAEDTLNALNERISTIESKLESMKDQTDEFFEKVKIEMTKSLKQALIEKSTIENKLCTTFNVDMFITQLKTLLKPYEEVTDISTFPFKQLFNNAIVVSRNEIIFTIGSKENKEKLDLTGTKIYEDELKWFIRTQELTTKFCILIQ